MPTTSQAGIVSAIVGNIIINLAVNLQKRAKLRLVRLALRGVHVPSRTDYQKILALTLLVTGQFSNFIAYGLAPASIVSPLGVLAVISNCVIPPLLFDETPSINSITGTTIALPGILLLIVSSPQNEDKFVYPLELGAKMYLSSLCLLVLGCAMLRSSVTEARITLRTDSVLAAVMGTFCVLSIKSAATIIMENDESRGGLLLALVLVILIAGVLQLVIMANIIGQHPIWLAVPHLFAFFTVFVGLGSAIVFHELRNCGFVAKSEFLAGCILTIIGVWISAKPRDTVPVGIRVKRARALGPPKRKRNNRKQRQRKQQQKKKLEKFPEYHPSTPNQHHREETMFHSRPRSRNSRRSRSNSGSHGPGSRGRRSNSTAARRSSSGGYNYKSFPLFPQRIDLEVHQSRSLPEREFLIPHRRFRPSSPHPIEAEIELGETSLLLVPRRITSGGSQSIHSVLSMH